MFHIAARSNSRMKQSASSPPNSEVSSNAVCCLRAVSSSGISSMTSFTRADSGTRFGKVRSAHVLITWATVPMLSQFALWNSLSRASWSLVSIVRHPAQVVTLSLQERLQP